MSRDRSQAGEGQQAPGPGDLGGQDAPLPARGLAHHLGPSGSVTCSDSSPTTCRGGRRDAPGCPRPQTGRCLTPGPARSSANACELGTAAGVTFPQRATHAPGLPAAAGVRAPQAPGRSPPGPHAAASPLRPRLLRGAHLKPGPAWAPQGPGQLSGGGCPRPRGAACLGSVWTGLQAAPSPSVLRLCREAERRHASAEERGARAGAPSLGSLLRGRGQGRLGAAALAREGRRQVTCGDAAWARFRAWHARSPRASRPFLPSSPLSRCKHCGRSPHRRGGGGGCWGRT